ncbi:MAG TPA: glycosyl hydrolase [Flavobacteriales bacterium]|nr:glycosyl hydrolase [Flavobacteriales bacterium]
MTSNPISRELFTLFACSLAWAGCARQVDTLINGNILEINKVEEPAFLSVESVWVDSILGTLSMEEQVAQLLMVPVYSRTDTSGWDEAEDWVRDLGLGGIICMQGGPENQRNRINRLQSLSEVPLMVASDAEWGLGMRLDSTRSFPRALTLGATGDAELVRRFGRAVGVSLRNTGITVNFAPVVDVNSNSINPVIGSRSFGENVQLVGELGLAYSRGLQDVNVLATAKHFPGHGDSDSDSHKTLPRISGDRARLDSVELAPFRVLIDGGVGAIMVAHLDVPALDSTDAQPSTLSPAIVDTLLRQELGFKGLAFTDALSMKGFADFAGDRPRARDALLAGNDILLFPGDPIEVIAEIIDALKNGSIDSSLVTEKCRRVLRAKVWTKANEELPANGMPWDARESEEVHREILRASLTLLTNENEVIPMLKSAGKIAIINVANKGASGDEFTEHLIRTLGRSFEVNSFTVGKDCSRWGRSDVQNACENADLVLINFLETSNRPSKNYGILKPALDACSSRIASSKSDTLSNTKWVVNLFANPYAVNEDWEGVIEGADGLVLAYQDDYRTQEAVVDLICGVTGTRGALPVTPPGSPFKEGWGIEVVKPESGRLGFNPSACGGAWEPSLKIDSIVEVALEAGAYPGCRVVVSHKGIVMHDEKYGTTDGKIQVSENTIYDLASITKVAATTLCLMRLEEEGKFDLDYPISEYLQELDTLELGTRTFRQILSHQAGLYPWIPFYLETLSDSLDLLSDRPMCDDNICINPNLFLCEEFVDTMYLRIVESELRPSGEYRYSDLGYYLIHKILNQLYGTTRAVDSLSTTWFYNPMGLYSMGFNPLARPGFLIDDIAPTEEDKVFRKCVVQGHVHDPGAALLGGVCGHAGLFSDAHDLTRLGQMLLDNGSYLGVDLLDSKKSTIDTWTSRAFPDSDSNRRGLGFDKPALELDSGPTCDIASTSSFGHSGFTGTLLWVDPEFDLVYVFLSNRTYPDAENSKLITLDVRTEIQRVVMEHLNAPIR